MPHSPITAGTQVVYQDGIYTVRAVDGNVLELAYHTGDFFRLVHASSVLVCPPPATQTAASLPAPAAVQGAGTFHQRARQWLHADPLLLVAFQLVTLVISCLNALYVFWARVVA